MLFDSLATLQSGVPDMRRLSVAFTALLATAAIVPQALAANIDQNGDYL
jgi:hypothetical protein